MSQDQSWQLKRETDQDFSYDDDHIQMDDAEEDNIHVNSIAPSERMAEQSRKFGQLSLQAGSNAFTQSGYQNEGDDQNNQIIQKQLTSLQMSNLKYQKQRSSQFQRQGTMCKEGDLGVDSLRQSQRTDDNYPTNNDNSNLALPDINGTNAKISRGVEEPVRNGGISRAKTMGALNIKGKTVEKEKNEGGGNDSGEDLKNIEDENKDEVFDEDDLLEGFEAGEGTNHVHNMEKYVKEYGATLEVQSHYVLDTKIYPCDITKVLQVIKYQIPEDLYKKTKTHNTKEIDPDQEIHDNPCYDNKNNCLRLIDFNKNYLDIIYEIPIPQGSKFKMSFSPNGNYFILYMKKLNILQIYKIYKNNLQNLLQRIDQGEQPIREYNTLNDGVFIKNSRVLKWAPNSDYLIVFSYEKMSIIDFTDNYDSKYEIVDNFNIFKKSDGGIDQPKKQYRAILDAQISTLHLSEQEKFDKGYRCDVALLQDSEDQVIIRKIQSDVDNFKRIIPFKNKNILGIKISISNDFSKVVYTNEWENLILSRVIQEGQDDDENYANYNLGTLSWLNKKVVYHIMPIGKSNFLFFSSKLFDLDLDIYCSWTKNFKMAIKRKIEPESIIIYDAFMSPDEDENEFGLGSELHILSYRDDEIFYDILWPLVHNEKIKDMKEEIIKGKKHQKFMQRDEIAIQISQEETQGFCCAWPYITFKGIKHFQYIYNVYFDEQIERIQLPSDCIGVAATKITKTLDLFILGEFENFYKLWVIDLEKFRKKNRYILKEIFVYLKEQVGNMPLLDFHIRPSSDKEDISLNKKLCLLVLHECPDHNVSKLYFWCNVAKMGQLKKVCDTKNTKIQEVNEDTIVYSQDIKDSQGKQKFSIQRMTLEFSDYVVQSIYEHKKGTDTVKTYAYDINQNVAIIVTINILKKRLGKSITIIDLNQNNNLYRGKLQDPELAGRLKTGLFIFVDGHIYYNNKCIKLRYDILKKENNSGDFLEYQVFDFYDYLLQLQIGEQVQKRMPLSSSISHRMIYLIKNRKKLAIKKILILPNLHERKIYLFNKKSNNDYFYTIYNEYIVKKEEEFPIRVPYLVSMNLSQSIVEVYNMKGILQGIPLDFKDIRSKFGNPKAVSNNGQVFIFQKSKSFTLNIIILTLTGLYKIKSIEVQQDIYKFIEFKVNEGGKGIEEFQILKNKIETGGEFQHLSDPENCKINYKINDYMDVIIQIMPSKKKQIKANLNNKKKLKNMILSDADNQANLGGKISGQAMTILQKLSINGLKLLQEAQNNLIYFQKGTYGIVYEELDSKYKKAIDIAQKTSGANSKSNTESSRSKSKNKSFFVSEQREESQQSIFQTYGNSEFKHGLDGMAINKSHVYFWNKFNIWYFDTWTDNHEFHRLGLFVDKQDKNTFIRTVRTGSNDEKIAVVVRQSAKSDSTIIWSVENDGELEQFDNGISPKILWDSLGEAYITEQDKVYFSEMGVVMKAFDVGDINKQENTMKKSRQEAFGFHYGYKFDDLSHSFMFLREYISLSYCYMTFAINYKMQKLVDYNNKDYLFDQEMYNFIIDKKTFLHDRKLIKNSHYLSYILKNFMKIDQILIEQLQYYFKKKVQINAQTKEARDQVVTPLHIAIEEQNNKSINILLFYMSQLDYSQFKTFQDLWPQLINFHQFPQFLREQTFFNMQMANKQSLKVANPINKNIVALEVSQGSYVDEFYFRNKMHEQQDNKHYNSYPVKVVGLEIGWLINGVWGKRFLTAILTSENLDLYEIDSIVIIVEWLYSKYVISALYRRLPAYIASFLVFLVTIWLQESQDIRYIERLNQNIIFERNINLSAIQVNSALPEAKQVKIPLLSFQALNNIANKTAKQDNSLIGASIFGLICTVVQIYIMRNMILNSWNSYWRSQWSYIDILYVTLNTLMCLMIIPSDFDIKSVRVIQSILAIVITLKMLYFFALYEPMSHLIQIMFKVFKDILPFLAILIIVMFAFANSFWMIGQNQLQFDKVPVGAEPRYVSFSGSLQYIRFVSLGEYETDSFSVGLGSQKAVLIIVFIIASFVVIVVLISMLVAIMGDTFNYNRSIKNLVLMKSKLKFVIDNFWIEGALGKEDEKMKCTYLITAMFNEEDDEDVEILKDVQEEMHEINYERKQQSEFIMTELKKIKNKLSVMEEKENAS